VNINFQLLADRFPSLVISHSSNLSPQLISSALMSLYSLLTQFVSFL